MDYTQVDMKSTSRTSLKKMPKSMAITARSAEAVASVEDLLLEILLRVPIRSLLRFKSVSKRWLSLITDPRFALIHNTSRNPNPALGLFLPSSSSFHDNPEFDYIHFDVHNPINPPFRKLEFAKDPSGIVILKSCNGLLLCSSFRAQEFERFYYVYNPTTNQSLKLPKPIDTYCVSLAFDPSKSPHYKVILVRGSNFGPTYYQIEVYSSESCSWRTSGDPFSASRVIFQNGVYWNGAIHWISNNLGDTNTTPLYFDIDQEKVKPFPLPAIPGRIAYFGESCDHLHLIPKHGNQSHEFNVYELKKDYSEWFVKYKVDLSVLCDSFPGIIRKNVRITYNSQIHERDWMIRIPTGLREFVFSVFTVIRGEKEEDFLVLQIPGKAIRYNLVNNTFQKLCDLEGDEEDGFLRFNSASVSPYIESLYCI